MSVEVLPMRAARGRSPRTGSRPAGCRWPAWGTRAAYTARLAARLRRLQPDLVHTNSMKAAVYGALAARMARLPVVWHLHDRIAEEYLRARPSAPCAWRPGTLPSAVIANSRSTLETIEPLSRPTAIIPCAVDAGAGAHAARRGDGPLSIGMIGRIAPWKGQDVFLNAFAQAFPVGDATATVVGAPLFGEEDYEREVRGLRRAAGAERPGQLRRLPRTMSAPSSRGWTCWSTPR